MYLIFICNEIPKKSKFCYIFTHLKLHTSLFLVGGALVGHEEDISGLILCAVCGILTPSSDVNKQLKFGAFLCTSCLQFAMSTTKRNVKVVCNNQCHITDKSESNCAYCWMQLVSCVTSKVLLNNVSSVQLENAGQIILLDRLVIFIFSGFQIHHFTCWIWILGIGIYLKI